MDGAGFAGLVCTLDDQQRGLLYLGATPVSVYAQNWPTITAIADSISYTPELATAPAPDAGLTYVTWADPNENAFTIEVPKGWSIDGGMADFGGTKIPYLMLFDPAETIELLVGMAELIWFLEPSPDLTNAGYPSGTEFYSDNSVTIIVEGHMTGGEAAQYLTETWLDPFCDTFKTTATRNLGDGYAVDGSYLNAGDTAFTCAGGDETIVGS